MERKFSKFEIATIKRTAQNVNPMVTKRHKLLEQINKLQKEYDDLTTMQEQYEASIKTLTGGYTTEDLVNKTTVIVGTGTESAKSIVKWVLKYPLTVIPPYENNEEIEVTNNVHTEEVDDQELAPEVEIKNEEVKNEE